MSYSPLAIKRSNILGNIYKQCDTIESIPVYMNSQTGEFLGFVDESLDRYADTFLFHLSEPVCKQLSSNHFDYAFDFEYAEKTVQNANKKRIKLNYILLIEKKTSVAKKSIS